MHSIIVTSFTLIEELMIFEFFILLAVQLEFDGLCELFHIPGLRQDINLILMQLLASILDLF